MSCTWHWLFKDPQLFYRLLLTLSVFDSSWYSIPFSILHFLGTGKKPGGSIISSLRYWEFYRWFCVWPTAPPCGAIVSDFPLFVMFSLTHWLRSVQAVFNRVPHVCILSRSCPPGFSLPLMCRTRWWSVCLTWLRYRSRWDFSLLQATVSPRPAIFSLDVSL